MQLHSTSLLLAASASLAIASVAAATIGVRQRQRRGVWWWIAANLGLAAALAVHALEDQTDLFMIRRRLTFPGQPKTIEELTSMNNDDYHYTYQWHAGAWGEAAKLGT